jgi:hypothetical protein
MTNEIEALIQKFVSLQSVLDSPFWKDPAFWITLLVTLAGVVFAILAFIEARKAKAAATEAGKTVKIQTVAIELTEISQRLDILGMEIRFNEARDLLNEISRKLRRLVSPFQTDPELKETVASLKEALNSAKNSLNDVRPTEPLEEEQPPNAVYYAIEADLANINGFVADMLGLLEKKTIDLGEHHEKT